MPSARATTSWCITKATTSFRSTKGRGRRLAREPPPSHRFSELPSCMLAYAALITGVGLGSMYGLLALGFHVTYAVSNTVNFAQGSTMMLGAVLCFTFWVTFGWPLALAIPASLLLCAVWSVIVEQVAVRPFVRSGSNSWLMATVALGIVIENVVLFTFGKDPRGFPVGYLTTTYVPVGGIKVQALQLIIPVIGLLL